MEELKNCIRKYQRVDNDILEMNKSIYSLREERRAIEAEMAEVVKNPQFEGINSLKLEDGSNIRIQRPQKWSKPWSMSRRDLNQYLEEYFRSASKPTAEDCMNFILQSKERTLISDEFAFTRNVGKVD